MRVKNKTYLPDQTRTKKFTETTDLVESNDNNIRFMREYFDRFVAVKLIN